MKKTKTLRALCASSAAPVKWLSDFTGQAGVEIITENLTNEYTADAFAFLRAALLRFINF